MSEGKNMTRFEIRDDFYLDGKSFKILSGAIHYFRVPPEDWYHSLYNLKALGFNTVETYVAWNLHEPREGEFHFEGALDLKRFLETAQDLGLYAIVRPSPFICAEWEFGGLPAWLLTKNMRLRSSDPAYIEAVGRYYDQLLSRLVPHLLDNGGNILMMQVENEYGSYGEDKAYLRAIRKLMEERGIDCPLFTSDGPWRATLKAGTLIEDDLFVTGNFGSKAPYNFSQMLVQSLEGTDYHTGSERIGRSCSRGIGARLYQSLHVPRWYKLWLHEWLLGSRDFGPTTSYIL